MIRARTSAIEALHGELRSPLSEVSSPAWTSFVHVLTLAELGPVSRARPFGTVSAGGLGCFAMPPRRLVDLGVLKRVIVVRGKALADPKDAGLAAFLSNPIEQYRVLAASLRMYDLATRTCPLPAGMTRSGSLALHHRLGPSALAKWARHQEPSTTALFQRANGLF